MEIIKSRRSIDDVENKYRVKYKNDEEQIGYEVVSYEDLNNDLSPKENKIDLNDLESKDFILSLERSEYRKHLIDEWDEDNDDFYKKKEKIENDIKKYPILKDYILYREEEQGESIVIFEEILTEILF